MGYVYVKIFLGTPVHQGASLQRIAIPKHCRHRCKRHHRPDTNMPNKDVGTHLLAAGIKPMASGKAERVRPPAQNPPPSNPQIPDNPDAPKVRPYNVLLFNQLLFLL